MYTDIIIQVATITGSTPFIMALVEMFKPYVKDTNLYPWIAVGLGILLQFLIVPALYALSYSVIVAAVLSGMLAGFIASGIYDKVQPKQPTVEPPKVP